MSRRAFALLLCSMLSCEFPFETPREFVPVAGTTFSGKVVDQDGYPVRAMVQVRFANDGCCGSGHVWTNSKGEYRVGTHFYPESLESPDSVAWLLAVIPQGPYLPFLKDSTRVAFSFDAARRDTATVRMNTSCPPASYCAAR